MWTLKIFETLNFLEIFFQVIFSYFGRSDYDTYDRDLNTHKSDFYNQMVIIDTYECDYDTHEIDYDTHTC
jgi:hypothetical protein